MGTANGCCSEIRSQDLPACCSRDHKMPPALTRRKPLTKADTRRSPLLLSPHFLMLVLEISTGNSRIPVLAWDAINTHSTPTFSFPDSSSPAPLKTPLEINKVETLTTVQTDSYLFAWSPLFLLPMTFSGICPSEPWRTGLAGWVKRLDS